MNRPSELPRLAGSRVLVVEDEFFIADDLHSALTSCGAEVLGPVPTCAEAITIIQDDDAISFAVLDINLGGELCFPVADALVGRGIPFVFATGYEPDAVPDRFAQVRLWEKPFNLSDIVEAVPPVAAAHRAS